MILPWLWPLILSKSSEFHDEIFKIAAELLNFLNILYKFIANSKKLRIFVCSKLT